MRICFVAPANNYHTKKWCGWFSRRGHEVHVLSFIDDTVEGAKVHYIDTGAGARESDWKKIRYLAQAKKIKKLVGQIKPDVVNAHYATSYGTATALSGVKPNFLSVWGSDVYDFPNKSVLHRALLQFSLKRATYLFSTSRAMAAEAGKYTNKPIEITPFGVDTKLFAPDKADTSAKHGAFVVGTVKGLHPKYGIEYLLKAAAILQRQYPEMGLQLRIAGKGEYEQEYKALAERLGIAGLTTWLGFISQKEAAREWAGMDVAVVYSIHESFGVSAVEANACGTALVISDAPGLMEATDPGSTSVVVPKADEQALAKAIYRLYCNPGLRAQMGQAGRSFVLENYELDSCFSQIEHKLRIESV